MLSSSKKIALILFGYIYFGYNSYNIFCLATFIDGKPIISLPPKTVSMKKLDFRAEERKFYSTLEENSREQFQVCYYAFTSLYSYAYT